MNRIKAGLAVGALATTLTGLVSTGTAAEAAAPQWKTERGIVVECTGATHGVQIWTSVYDNHRYGNTVQVVIGDPDDGNGNVRSTDEKFLVDGVVKAQVKVNGKRAVIKGTAERVGPRARVYEEYDDAGYLIKTRGFHRQLRTALVATYAGTTVPLTCDPAFAYDLEVKKIPIT
jgi:hypothetical protein